jgi:pyridoxamine 5'-phosphate oxidase
MSPRRRENPALDREHVADDPLEQFATWFDEALAVAPLAEAMTLATVDADCAPNARMVLLKGFGPEGFRFFTNYESAKGEELAASPRAALVVYWRELDRQVRARGRVEPLEDTESDAYFASRPRDSQLGAWASPQSRPIESRAALDDRLRELERRFGDEVVPRPDFWGGFVLRHESVEFWQGQQARLHDRFLYRRDGEGWAIERLGP